MATYSKMYPVWKWDNKFGKDNQEVMEEIAHSLPNAVKFMFWLVSDDYNECEVDIDSKMPAGIPFKWEGLTVRVMAFVNGHLFAEILPAYILYGGENDCEIYCNDDDLQEHFS